MLSQLLGLGKGSFRLRMMPLDALGEILQVCPWLSLWTKNVVYRIYDLLQAWQEANVFLVTIGARNI